MEKKDKITLEVEGDKKSTNSKMYAVREFVFNFGQVGEGGGNRKQTFLMAQFMNNKFLFQNESKTKHQIYHAISARKLWRQELGPNGDPEGRVGPRWSVGRTFLGA